MDDQLVAEIHLTAVTTAELRAGSRGCRTAAGSWTWPAGSSGVLSRTLPAASCRSMTAPRFTTPRSSRTGSSAARPSAWPTPRSPPYVVTTVAVSLPATRRTLPTPAFTSSTCGARSTEGSSSGGMPHCAGRQRCRWSGDRPARRRGPDHGGQDGHGPGHGLSSTVIYYAAQDLAASPPFHAACVPAKGSPRYSDVDDGGPPGTRTPNLWIKSPQLCH